MNTRSLRVVTNLSLVAAILMTATSLMAAPLGNFGNGYRETWNTYALGQADATYNSVWTSSTVTAGIGGQATYAPGSYPVVNNVNSISTPNDITIDRTRLLTNSLVDGISSGDIGSTELSAGQVLKPDATVALNTANTLANVDNLQLRMFWNSGAGNKRKYTGVYSELSYGNVHAPALTGALDPLAEAIPVVAIGKLNGNYTGTSGGSGLTTLCYYFDGMQWKWVASNFEAGAVNNDMAGKIYWNSDTSKWNLAIQWLAGTGSTTGSTLVTGLELKFDPTVLGFNTVSMMTNFSAGAGGYADDVWVAGGLVVPEPSTLIFLIGGGLALMRRRTR